MTLTASFSPDLTLNFLPVYWHSLVTPCLSLLADDCQLSIIATELATPLLLNGIYYQLTHLTQSPKTFDNLLILPALAQRSHGINFQQISQLRPQLATCHRALFSDDRPFWLMLGIVAARTGITPKHLQPLADWLIFLTLYSTAQCLSLTHTSIITFRHWLPTSLIDKKLMDTVMLESILFNSATHPSLLFYAPQSSLNEQTTELLQKDFFASHQAILQSYQQRQPFGILPLAETNHDNRATLPQVSHLNSINNIKSIQPLSATIFDLKKPVKSPLTTLLQKYWMAFAAGLTALVIGGIGAVATTYKTSPISPATNNKSLADIPHDVAIVRTDTIKTPATPNPIVNANNRSNTKINGAKIIDTKTKAAKTKDTKKTLLPKNKSDKTQANKSSIHHAPVNKKAPLAYKSDTNPKKSSKKSANSHTHKD